LERRRLKAQAGTLTTLDRAPTTSPREKEAAVAAERLSMRKLREILRLHLQMAMGPRTIARSLSPSPRTVSGDLGRVRVAKLIKQLPERRPHHEERAHAPIPPSAGGVDAPSG
jgi:hypothetical protein